MLWHSSREFLGEDWCSHSRHPAFACRCRQPDTHHRGLFRHWSSWMWIPSHRSSNHVLLWHQSSLLQMVGKETFWSPDHSRGHLWKQDNPGSSCIDPRTFNALRWIFLPAIFTAWGSETEPWWQKPFITWPFEDGFPVTLPCHHRWVHQRSYDFELGPKSFPSIPWTHWICSSSESSWATSHMAQFTHQMVGCHFRPCFRNPRNPTDAQDQFPAVHFRFVPSSTDHFRTSHEGTWTGFVWSPSLSYRTRWDRCIHDEHQQTDANCHSCTWDAIDTLPLWMQTIAFQPGTPPEERIVWDLNLTEQDDGAASWRSLCL